MDLQNKTILIMGASSGIGRGCAALAYKSGANLVLAARRRENLEELKKELESLNLKEGQLIQVQVCDITNTKDLDGLVSSLPKIDGFVNSTGIVKHHPIRSIGLSLEEVLNTNLLGPVNLIQKILKANKIQNGGSIVFLASLSSVLGPKALGAYTISKSGIVGLSKVLASELASKKIRSNCVSPGMVRTEIASLVEDQVSKEALERDELNYPLGYCDIEDVTGLVVFLLSDFSKKITGQNLLIDGGYTIK